MSHLNYHFCMALKIFVMANGAHNDLLNYCHLTSCTSYIRSLATHENHLSITSEIVRRFVLFHFVRPWNAYFSYLAATFQNTSGNGRRHEKYLLWLVTSSRCSFSFGFAWDLSCAIFFSHSLFHHLFWAIVCVRLVPISFVLSFADEWCELFAHAST